MTAARARERLAHAARIGIVRTDHLGDMVLTLPLVRALKEEFPQAEIVVFAHSRTAPLIEGTDVVDRCCYVDQTPLGELLAHVSCGALFFPRAQAEEVLIAWRHRVPIRVGTAYRWWSPFYNVRIRDHRSRADFHEAEYNARMLQQITGKRYRVELVRPAISDEARARVRHLLDSTGVQLNSRMIVLHPGGRGSAPRWGQFPALARLVEQMLPDWHIVVTGTAAEEALCHAIVNAVPHTINLCGALSLAQLIALLDQVAIVVANSTGVLHIAAALGTPVVGIFPSWPPAVSPSRWRPLVEPSTVLAATPIEQISPQAVATAVAEIVARCWR